jgi:predicted RNA-binding protein with PIN domain
MPLIIDGYNLMFAAGFVGQRTGPGGLERSRLALLNFIAESIDESALTTTTVVFDARHAPTGLPGTLLFRGMTVRFATGCESADELIEELIRAASAPRRLLVVSGDHRLQTAARHRRAKAIDSEQWHAEMLRLRASRHATAPPATVKPQEPASCEVEFWLRQFADEASNLPEADDIFPPGYGEDVRE